MMEGVEAVSSSILKVITKNILMIVMILMI